MSFSYCKWPFQDIQFIFFHFFFWLQNTLVFIECVWAGISRKLCVHTPNSAIMPLLICTHWYKLLFCFIIIITEGIKWTLNWPSVYFVLGRTVKLMYKLILFHVLRTLLQYHFNRHWSQSLQEVLHFCPFWTDQYKINNLNNKIYLYTAIPFSVWRKEYTK